MDINELKALVEEAGKAADMAHETYSKKSAIHKAALQVMAFEKELYYGDIAQTRHLQKIRDIIEINAEDIVNETN